MAGKFIELKSRSCTPLILQLLLIIRQSQGARGTLFGTKAAGCALIGHRFIVMIAQITPNTFSYANQTTDANILCYADYSVFGFRHCQRRTPFCAVTALVANLNFVIASILYYANGTFFLVGCFEKRF
jgi:hypothetical protein